VDIYLLPEFCLEWCCGTRGVLQTEMIQPSRLDLGHFNLAHVCDELPASVTRHFLQTEYSTAFGISLFGCFFDKPVIVSYVANVTILLTIVNSKREICITSAADRFRFLAG